MKKFLVVQTAFIGDVILATPIIEKLHQFYPDAQIDFMLRKGNEGLLIEHQFIKNLYVWDKSRGGKNRKLFDIISRIRIEKYDYIIVLQRFLSNSIIALFSGAKQKIGFDKNPFSFLFSKKIKHEIGNGEHEVSRNLKLITHLTDDKFVMPKLYPRKDDFQKVAEFKQSKYVCIAPSSVWFTKQLPENKWLQFIKLIPNDITIYLLGGSTDRFPCFELIRHAQRKNIVNLAGQLSFLESAALMQDAEMNYVNDSGPMHIASAMNAKTTAVFCCTVPDFGFGPLAQVSKIVQVEEKLDCRPCGLHGFTECPKQHFKCANDIDVKKMLLP